MAAILKKTQQVGVKTGSKQGRLEPIGSKSSHDHRRARIKNHTDPLGAKTIHETRQIGMTPDPLGSKSGHGHRRSSSDHRLQERTSRRSGVRKGRSNSRSREDNGGPIDPPMAKLKPIAFKRSPKEKQTNKISTEFVLSRKESDRRAKDNRENRKSDSLDSPSDIQSSRKGLATDVRRLRNGFSTGNDAQGKPEGVSDSAELVAPRKRSSSFHSTGIGFGSFSSLPIVTKTRSRDSAELIRQSSEKGFAPDFEGSEEGASMLDLAKAMLSEAEIQLMWKRG